VAGGVKGAELTSTRVKRVQVVPYSDLWPLLYAQEAERIRAALGGSLRVIEHVGSTSVPGLAAKPTIDIALSVDSFAELDIGALEDLGYEYVPEFEDELPNRRYFRRAGFHVHAYEREHEEFFDFLRFREYLRTHAEDAHDYGELKQRLAAEFSDRREDYQAAKAPYIERLVAMLRR
jgi:GrpB-like predicted nucleotidyltransferase (UPF0157 family)